jgi:hypothetical protein
MFSGGFKRSSRYGLIGVFVVGALTVVIGLTMGEGDANPKLALGLIFGVVALFVVGLLFLQFSDLDRVAGGDAATSARGAAEAGHRVEDPTKMEEAELWAALAVGPIDPDAITARSQMWEVNRRSLKLGAVVFLLIFLTVPPMYLFESFVPLLIGVPLILAAALYGAFLAIGPGGEIDSGYDRLDRAMKPLGLQVSERPKGGFEPRGPTMPGFDYRLRGATVLSGERHGRRVTVSFGGYEEPGVSQIAVAAPCNEFEAKSKRIAVHSGPDGIVVSRRKAGQSDWLCDLWLAERLAGA